jgi:hypothetical protein
MTHFGLSHQKIMYAYMWTLLEFDFQKCRCIVIIYDCTIYVIWLYSLITQIYWQLIKYDLTTRDLAFILLQLTARGKMLKISMVVHLVFFEFMKEKSLSIFKANKLLNIICIDPVISLTWKQAFLTFLLGILILIKIMSFSIVHIIQSTFFPQKC